MPKSGHVSYGVGKKAGPRKGKFKTPKKELFDVIEELRKRGFGITMIARMLGYTPSMIYQYLKEYGVADYKKPVSLEVRYEWFMSMLPDELRRRVTVIRTRSEISHQQKRNERDGASSAVVHHLLDEEESCAV